MFLDKNNTISQSFGIFSSSHTLQPLFCMCHHFQLTASLYRPLLFFLHLSVNPNTSVSFCFLFFSTISISPTLVLSLFGTTWKILLFFLNLAFMFNEVTVSSSHKSVDVETPLYLYIMGHRKSIQQYWTMLLPLGDWALAKKLKGQSSIKSSIPSIPQWFVSFIGEWTNFFLLPRHFLILASFGQLLQSYWDLFCRFPDWLIIRKAFQAVPRPHCGENVGPACNMPLVPGLYIRQLLLTPLV